MVGKFRLKDNTKIAWDPDTNITWTGNKVIESEITVFVAKCITKSVLVEVKGKEAVVDKDKVVDTDGLKKIVEQKIEELEKASEADFEKKKKELEEAEENLKKAEPAKK